MTSARHVCAIILGDVRYDSRCTKILTSLRDRGFRTSVVTAVDGDTYDSSPGCTQIPVMFPRTVSTKRKFASFYRRAFREVLKLHPDAVLAADLYSLPPAWAVSVMLRIPVIYDSRELYRSIAALHKRRLMQAFWSFVERILIRRVTLILTVNESLAGFLRSFYPDRNIGILRNIPRKKNVTRTDRIRSLLGLPMGKKIILYQGGLQAGRGISLLLSAAEKIDGAEFVFMGNGPLEHVINERARSLPHVHHMNSVRADDILDYTASADIGTVLIENLGTSYYHSLPNKLFEYIHAGIPVIGSDFPEISAIINGYGVGCIANPENTADVVEALKKLISDDTGYRSFRAACIKASVILSWEEEFEKCYPALQPILEK